MKSISCHGVLLITTPARAVSARTGHIAITTYLRLCPPPGSCDSSSSYVLSISLHIAIKNDQLRGFVAEDGAYHSSTFDIRLSSSVALVPTASVPSPQCKPSNTPLLVNRGRSSDDLADFMLVRGSA
ncbi:hypothetical protein BO78DRAFT_196288 [Aspergillus sclerotiicarbonarius CBS 121057]|uniref:Uncharacterized protein n=1 Tax=Aspergillus sclerotiicarbonarius (strain CBS 121057 / IBT 28362) TaxID=1448318 RepID=A0A319E547_ASPSB|nr:hypothetical protein BO78DRAFT_196288 [Aspergillus sclerotiicarbonarius CBS 121057]